MAVAAHRGSALLHYRLAQSLGWWGWRGGAQRACRDALACDPLYPEAHVLLGETLAAAGRWAEAAACFRDASRLEPSCAEIQGRLVLALGRARRFGEAVSALERLVRLRPGEAELHLLRGALLVRCGRGAEAIRTFRWAVGLAPAPEWRRCFLGEAVLGEREWERLRASFLAASRLPVRSSPPTLRGGSPLNRCPPFVLAKGNDRASLLRTPVGLPAGLVSWIRSTRLVLGRAGRRALGRGGVVVSHLLLPHRGGAGSSAFALRQARRLALAGRAVAGGVLVLCALAPGAAAAAGARGDSLAALEQLHLCYTLTRAQAVEPCKSALALGLTPPRARWARRVLAYKLEALERWDEAVEVYRRQVAEQPEDAEAHRRLGSLLLYAQDRPEEAAEELREALRLAPDDALAHGALAGALNALGRYADSVAEFDRALALDPAYLDSRPAARLVLEASRRGEAWP